MGNAYIGSPAPGLLFFASDGVSNMPYDAPGVLPIIHQKNVVIIRYDATSRQLETTLNGQSNGTVNVPAGMNITNSDSLKFGGSEVMYDFYASAIWNQALSETQVQQVNDALAQ